MTIIIEIIIIIIIIIMIRRIIIKIIDNAVVDAIKLIQLNYSNFSIAKIVVKKIERVK